MNHPTAVLVWLGLPFHFTLAWLVAGLELALTPVALAPAPGPTPARAPQPPR